MLLNQCPPVRAYKSSTAPSSFFEPTDADLDLYYSLAMKLHAQPPSCLFRYLLPEGQHLMHLGDRAPWVWGHLLNVVATKWPNLPTRGLVASDGTRLNSAIERIAYEAIIPVVPSDVAIDLEAAINSGDRSRLFHSDIAIRVQSQVQHVEIVGACGSDRVTRNEWEQKLLAQFDRRLLIYDACRIQPEIWYLNDLLEPQHLQRRFLTIVTRLRRGGVA